MVGMVTPEPCWQDVRYGTRVLRREPVFAVVAIASLAIGIGATSAIFTLMNAVMFRMIPAGESERHRR